MYSNNFSKIASRSKNKNLYLIARVSPFVPFIYYITSTNRIVWNLFWNIVASFRTVSRSCTWTKFTTRRVVTTDAIDTNDNKAMLIIEKLKTRRRNWKNWREGRSEREGVVVGTTKNRWDKGSRGWRRIKRERVINDNWRSKEKRRMGGEKRRGSLQHFQIWSFVIRLVIGKHRYWRHSYSCF